MAYIGRCWIFLMILPAIVCFPNCTFPNDLYDTEKEWRTHDQDATVKADYDHKFYTLKFYKWPTFKDSIIIKYYMHEIRNTGEEIFRCETLLTDDTFIIKKQLETHNENGEINKNEDVFECIQFIRVNKNVYRWSKSRRSNSSEDLCNSIQQNEVGPPLIYYHTNGFWREKRNKNIDYQTCPYSGGYVMYWKDENTKARLCDEDIPAIKFEMQCENGQGVEFHTRNTENCRKSDFSKYLDRGQLSCLAHWNMKNDTYTILVHPHIDRLQLCLRLPTNRKDFFWGYVFPDGKCDYSDSLQENMDYRVITLRKDVVKDLCSDESSDCYYYEGEDCDFPIAEACRRTCKVCSQSQLIESNITIPSMYHGEWTKHTEDLGPEIVTINDTHITIPSLNSYLILSESFCSNVLHKNNIRETNEFIILALFDNGCSPQMKSIMLSQRNNSVISFTLSQSLPIDINPDVNDDLSWKVSSTMWGPKCSTLKYDADYEPINDHYRPSSRGWYNLARNTNRSQRETVPCNIPVNDTYNHFKLTMEDMYECSGAFVFNEFTQNDTLEFHVEECIDKRESEKIKDQVIPPKQTSIYRCLSVFEGDENIVTMKQPRTFLITSVENSHSLTADTFQCWIFLEEIEEVVLMRLSDCDTNTEYKLDNNMRKPIARLKFSYHSKSCRIYCDLFLTLIVFILYKIHDVFLNN